MVNVVQGMKGLNRHFGKGIAGLSGRVITRSHTAMNDSGAITTLCGIVYLLFALVQPRLVGLANLATNTHGSRLAQAEEV